MKKFKTNFESLLLFKNKNNKDDRGHLREVFKKKKLKNNFKFDYFSFSKKNTLRGLHLQRKFMQDKLVIIIKGKIIDYCLDLRKHSKTYLKTFKQILSPDNYNSIYIPKGFAHGFLALNKENIILYKNSNYRHEKSEITIDIFDKDLKLGIKKKTKYIISAKDKAGIKLAEYIAMK